MILRIAARALLLGGAWFLAAQLAAHHPITATAAALAAALVGATP